MTNRENPVWQSTFGAYMARAILDYRAHNGDTLPNVEEYSSIVDDAKTCADAAVEELGEPQPESAPQPRDESGDIWIERYDGSGDERYVPYSRLETALALLDTAHQARDSELLDAILEAWLERDLTTIGVLVSTAIAERAKR